MKEKIKIENLFPNFIATKNLDILKLKIKGENFKKSFESKIKTTLNSETLFDINSMNYLNIELTNLLSHLLKPLCKTFVFKLIDVWINKYDEKDYQAAHVHPSDFSFIIYYKTNKSYTVFNSPIKKIIESTASKIFSNYISYEPKLKQGDIIVFPSYLEHWVKPNSNNITVAGNIKIIDMKGKNE